MRPGTYAEALGDFKALRPDKIKESNRFGKVSTGTRTVLQWRIFNKRNNNLHYFVTVYKLMERKKNKLPSPSDTNQA